MLQSYIVWDDSESERGLLFGCLCSAAALLRNGGGFPPTWVFLDHCVNSRDLCTVWASEAATPMHVCGNPFVSFCHVIKKNRNKTDVLGDTEAFTLAEGYCCIKVDENAQQRQSCAGSDGPLT